MQPPSSSAAAGGASHFDEVGLQTKPDAQSDDELHCSTHRPPLQSDGEHEVSLPSLMTLVPSAEHCVGAHLPAAQLKPVSQSALVAHAVLHLVVPSQVSPLQPCGAPAVQAPMLSQRLIVSAPAAQDEPHSVPTLYAQLPPFTPSQEPAHVPVPRQAVRAAFGALEAGIGEQVPSFPVSMHDSH